MENECVKIKEEYTFEYTNSESGTVTQETVSHGYVSLHLEQPKIENAVKSEQHSIKREDDVINNCDVFDVYEETKLEGDENINTPANITNSYSEYDDTSLINSELVVQHGKISYKCMLCTYSTPHDLETLKTHMETHFCETPHECTMCEYTIDKKNMVINHILTTHSTDNPYKCTLCP